MARAQSSPSACGIRVASSTLASTRAAVAEIKERLGSGAFQRIVTYFAIEHDAKSLAAALTEAFPGVPVSGCSTAGEIGLAVMTVCLARSPGVRGVPCALR